MSVEIIDKFEVSAISDIDKQPDARQWKIPTPRAIFRVGIKLFRIQHPLINSLMTYDTQYNNREIEYIDHNCSSDASSL